MLRILAAFVFAPLLPSAALAIIMFRDGQFIQGGAITAIVAYGMTLVFAVPVFLWVRLTERGVTLRRVLVSAFLIVAVPASILGSTAPASLRRKVPQ